VITEKEGSVENVAKVQLRLEVKVTRLCLSSIVFVCQLFSWSCRRVQLLVITLDHKCFAFFLFFFTSDNTQNHIYIYSLFVFTISSFQESTWNCILSSGLLKMAPRINYFANQLLIWTCMDIHSFQMRESNEAALLCCKNCYYCYYWYFRGNGVIVEDLSQLWSKNSDYIDN